MIQPLEGAMAPVLENPIGDRTINGLVAFIFRDFVGQGPVTREYCFQIVGEGETRCEAYPTEAEVAAGAGGGP
jgi:hypothetical protein